MTKRLCFCTDCCCKWLDKRTCAFFISILSMIYYVIGLISSLIFISDGFFVGFYMLFVAMFGLGLSTVLFFAGYMKNSILALIWMVGHAIEMVLILGSIGLMIGVALEVHDETFPIGDNLTKGYVVVRLSFDLLLAIPWLLACFYFLWAGNCLMEEYKDHTIEGIVDSLRSFFN